MEYGEEGGKEFATNHFEIVLLLVRATSESINNVELQYLSTDISLNSPMNGEESGKLRNSLLRCYENETYFEREGKRILPISLLVRSNQYKFGQKQRSIH